jgi:AraC-like DNA-binding protein
MAATSCIKPIRLCLLAAARSGENPLELARSYGLADGVIDDPYARVPHELLARLYTEIPARVGDRSFGLHAAQVGYALSHDAFDGALRHTPTVGDALRLLARFARLQHDAAQLDIRDEGDAVRYSLRLDCSPPAPPAFIELVLSMWALRGPALSSESWLPRELAFRRAAPASTVEYEAVYRTRVTWGAPADSMLVARQDLALPVRGADRVLGRVLERHLDDELSRMPPPDQLLPRVHAAVAESVADADFDIDRLARRVGMSRRTLQRRLADAGLTFQQLVDEARRDASLRSMRDPNLSIADVAFGVGYGDMSTFYRSFRRWTGRTPAEWRSAPA